MVCVLFFISSWSHFCSVRCSNQLHTDVTWRYRASCTLYVVFSDPEIFYHYHERHLWTHLVFLMHMQAWIWEGVNFPWDNTRSLGNKSTKFPPKLIIDPLQLCNFWSASSRNQCQSLHIAIPLLEAMCSLYDRLLTLDHIYPGGGAIFSCQNWNHL